MSEQVCAYCQENKKFTKEHLWPTSLHKRLYNANNQTESNFWLSRLQRSIPNEPTIKDVCATCNNITLSELDSYICNLFDSDFINIVKFNEKISFDYDYHLLKRWLLKMSFNSARIHDSHDRQALKDILPYILGKNDKLGRSVQLFTLLTYPEEVKVKEIDKSISSEETIIIEPTIHRVGHLHFSVPDIGQKLLRVVHLRSFTFFMAFWLPTGGKAEQNYFESIITQKMNGIKLLKPSESSIELECIGLGAWQSLKESRTKLEFSDEK